MVSHQNRNQKRFKDIIKGNIRKDLKDIIKSDKIYGRGKKDGKISIPIPWIDLPRFRHGKYEDGSTGQPGDGDGIGQGPGNVGDPIGPPTGEEGENGRKAGEGAGDHQIEVDVELEELAEILQEQLHLPNIEPKGKKKNISVVEDKLKGLRRVGPRALLRIRPTYFEALKRMVSEGTYNYDDPVVIVQPDDERYLSWKQHKSPIANAVIVYMMDVSGSMTDEHRDVARKTSFWIDLWLKSQYEEIECVYIIHDYEAEEVDYDTFFYTNTAGGTRIGAAYELADIIIDKKYPPRDWNIYLFQFSDGENFGDNKHELELLEKKLLPKSNLFCYGQINLSFATPWGKYETEGEFKKALDNYGLNSQWKDKIITHQIKNEDDIFGALKLFLGTGK